MTNEPKPLLPERALRRNYRLGVLNGAAFRLSLALVDGSIVLPWFVSQITASRVIIGLLLPVQNGGWLLPQLFLSRYVERQRRRLPLYNVACGVRWLFWLLLAASPFVLGTRRLGVVLAVVLVAYAGYSLFGGVTGLAFVDLVGQGVHARQRGTFFAWRNLTGGILALAGSLLVSWAMSPNGALAFPYNFGLLTLANLVVVTVMWVSLSFWVEVDYPTPPAREASLPDSVLGILRRDGNMRGFLLTRILLIGAGMSSPFFVVRAAELGGPQRLAGLFLAVYTATELCSNLLWGRLADQVSSKAVMAVLAGLAVGQNLLAAFFAPTWPPALYLAVFALLGVMQSGWMVISVALLLEIADPESRPVYIGLANTIMGIATLLLPLGGVLAQVKGLPPLFLLAAALAAAGLLSLTLWQDPRSPAYRRPRAAQSKTADLRL